MECARKAQLLADTVNFDTDVPKGSVETAAQATLQHQLAAICMECLEKSQSLAAGSSKDDEWDDECSTPGVTSPRDDERSTPRTVSRTPKFGPSSAESDSDASTTY